jgi:3-oxoacyl-[acyl-carrier protein] reductase
MLPMKLNGRTALVTGGSRGIGRAVAIALAEEGADVAINYVSSEAAARDVAEHIKKMGRNAILAQADVSDYPDTFRMAQDVLREFGHLDILVNNAGINSDKTFVKMDHASWRKVLGTNLDGVFNCTKVFVDQMLKQNYGRVVNVTSVIGQIGNFGQANYAASKAGVAAFTKSLAKELAGKGVTVNAVAPGFIETRLTVAKEQSEDPDLGIPEGIRNLALMMIPLGYAGQPEDVAKVHLFLASPDADYVSGQTLVVAGGMVRS